MNRVPQCPNTFEEQKKRRGLTLLSLSALGYPDSNQERQDQNLQCYHYTIAQSNDKISHLRCKVITFFWNYKTKSQKKQNYLRITASLSTFAKIFLYNNNV